MQASSASHGPDRQARGRGREHGWADANKALLRAIAWSPFLRDAKRRHEAWECRFERLAK